ncbi:hypothetical protein CC78DRAFT_215735 [Lojkania enalia]|uniref:Ankyrin n=1 Tax=Lojkania enalia TaxID=147567 RepID=A0A9P4K8Y9_9PLEO|nr:hypothetical protein CC78DRAFT_215735 [Didymosphaeria enalia]
MTSNGDAVLNSSSISAGQLDVPSRNPNPLPSPSLPTVATSPKARKTTSPGSARDKRPSSSRAQNGDHASDDGQNESEAETVVLGDTKDDSAKEKKVIKVERNDDDDAARLRSIKEASHARSPPANGRKNSDPDAKEAKVNINGAKNGSERDARSPVPTSPSSRTASRHTKETSPADSAKSPVHSNTSPSYPSTRGRSSSTVESRKRKLRDESGAKSLEPPRQKAKTEGLKDLRNHPTSPATPGLGRNHKRSQSTQSVLQGVAGRRRKDGPSLHLPQERTNWSDSGSENSSSPRPVQTPSLSSHTRIKRNSHRALTSPARAVPHSKRNTDKFGATRLARESEKGDLSAVKAAYNAAPEELDQEDFAGITPLQKASLHGWDKVVGFLIDKGCRTDCESNDRDTPLIDAVENGHLEVVKILLNKGKVNPHHQNKKGQRAIDVLDPEEEDGEEIEKVLKEAMRRETNAANDDDDVQPGLTQQKSASRLLYNEYNQETLIEKAGDGDIAAVGELINSNIKPNIACGVAASRGGHYDILSILLASGLKADPDPSKHSETPMLVAIGRGHLKIINLLLEQDNFDPTRRNREGKTYYEISEERRGPKWEQERDALKTAYDSFRQNHRSPRRMKKEAPYPSAIRAKRKSSLSRRERSSSPRTESKRTNLTKSSSIPQGPPKARRLMSGKEIANREVKRRRRVVNEETSEEETSDDEVRPPNRKKPRSYSEGEEHKSVKKTIKARSDQDAPKKAVRARSDDSDHEHRRKPGPKIRQKTVPKATPDAESPDERKPVKKIVKSRQLEEKIKRRRPSEASVDDHKVKITPTASAKSTPAPPEKASTPDSVRERRQDAERQEVEAKRKVAEAEARKRQEEETRKRQEEEARKRQEEEARKRREEEARKRQEEEEARKRREEEARKRQEEEAARKAALEAEAKRKAAEEAEAKRLAEEAEAARVREEEEAKKRAEEEARRQEELAARRARISKLPRALRRACELGSNRPLHFAGEELGISAVFLPLFYATSEEISNHDEKSCVSKSYIMSFQAAGILGLPELDLARLEAPYSNWNRIDVTREQRESLLRQYDVALLAQDFRFPMEGTPEFDYDKIQESIKEARQQFLDMDGLYWIEDTMLYPEVEKVEILKPLLDDVKDPNKRRRICVAGGDCNMAPEKKHKPRKSFMDVVLGKAANTNGIKVEETNGG